MARDRLPDRRPSETLVVPVVVDGREVRILVTVGFADAGMTVPREVFCADWKAGTSLHAIVMDACILMSRLLQHGDRPDELAGTLCQPPSLVGTIARAVSSACGGRPGDLGPSREDGA